MNKRVLFVDDETNVLSSLKRSLGRQYEVDTALGGARALELVKRNKPYAVVVSDLRMPEMDGIQLLRQVAERQPDTVRMMLTGNADLDAAIEAVNEGHVFRFLTKPCQTHVLSGALRAGIEQHRLVTAEKEFLRGTLRGSVKVLTELLALASPEAFGRSERIKRIIRRVGAAMRLNELWKLELAAMLSQIGCAILPDEAFKKILRGETLSGEEQVMYEGHPKIGHELLMHIPNLDEVADIVLHQMETLRSNRFQPLGSRMLKIAIDFDTLTYGGVTPQNAFVTMRERKGFYDTELLEDFEKVLGVEEGYVKRQHFLKGLAPGMLIAESVRTPKGLLIMVKGQEVTETSILKLRNFAQAYGVVEPIAVFVPVEGPIPDPKE